MPFLIPLESMMGDSSFGVSIRLKSESRKM